MRNDERRKVKHLTARKPALLVLSIFLFLSLVSSLYAGTGIYPEPERSDTKEQYDQGNVPPELQGRYIWSEDAMDYIPFDWDAQVELPFPSTTINPR
jgi:hypothetical protein